MWDKLLLSYLYTSGFGQLCRRVGQWIGSNINSPRKSHLGYRNTPNYNCAFLWKTEIKKSDNSKGSRQCPAEEKSLEVSLGVHKLGCRGLLEEKQPV